MAAVTFSAGGPKAAVRSTGATGNAANVSEREDLANFISMISRDEAPFMSSIGKTKATAVLHEWQTDELAAPVDGAVAEGVSYATQAAAQAAEIYRTRLGNYTQINSKTIAVTGTKRAVDQAGVADEYAYQLKKRGIEMRRDQEFGLVHSWQSSAASSPRKFGGLQSWLNVNIVNALDDPTDYEAPAKTGAGVAATFDDGEVAVTDCNPLLLSHVDDLMQTIYEAGGRATRLMTSPANRRAFSARAQAAGSAVEGTGPGNTRRSVDDGKLRQSVELYMSDFGDIMVVPNYIMGLSYDSAADGDLQEAANFTSFLYDPMFFAIAVLRPMQEVDLGQLGDSIIGQLVEEITLEVKNPASGGMIVGTDGN
jgi:hypothetical protein